MGRARTARRTLAALSEADQALLARVKSAILEVEPDARVILYGSRARGDAEPDSDWDLLVLVDGPVDWKRDRRLAHHLYPLELELEAVLSVFLHSDEKWNSPLYRVLPYRSNVMSEGLEL
jgi:predicted nucleotidyltransferase